MATKANMTKPSANTKSNKPSYIDTFNVFDEDDQKSSKGERIPWTDTASPFSSLDFVHGNSDVDTSFDSRASFFEFSAVQEPAEFGYNAFAKKDDINSSSNNKNKNNQQPADDLFPWDPMASHSGNDLVSPEPGETTVMVVIREQFSTIYDDAGSTPSCNLEGSVFIQPLSTSFDERKAICVVVKDSHGYLDMVEEVPPMSTNITTTSDREKGDTVFRVSLPKNSLVEQPVANYICNPQLRPIPMLVKSRVQVTDDVSRVGFKVRANPSNTEPLSNVVILIAVPPFVQGETVKMSRKGGVWDEMKRTICWIIDKLEPGEVLEIQAQFQSGNLQKLAKVDLQFPVLVRADVPRLFSGISVSTDYKGEHSDDSIVSVNNKVSQCTRILHRKV